MKILTVRFENLNSLEGQWLIDFSHPAYIHSSIFAITGPTGSGKTTLLDAICLALYGRTPRLKTISKSTNEVLTRGCGHCFSEVTFETLKGSFRCHWSQHKSRKKASGDLQQPKHEIINNRDNSIIDNKIKNVAKAVEEVTGMTFDQFTRSILLAQGNFAAFLQAQPDERAPILEQITGTEIYSIISQKVYLRTASYEKQYQTLAEDIGSLSLFTEDEEKSLQTALIDLSRQSQELEFACNELQQQTKWLQNIAELKTEIDKLKSESAILSRKNTESAPTRLLLKNGKNANSLFPTYEKISHIKKLHQEELEECSFLIQENKDLQAAQPLLKEQFMLAETSVKQKKDAVHAEHNICKKVRELDVRIQEMLAQIEKQKLNLHSLEEQKNHIKFRTKQCTDEIADLEQQMSDCRLYLKNHSQDAELVENLSAILEKLQNLQEQHDKEKELLKLRDKLISDKSRLEEMVRISNTDFQKITEESVSVINKKKEIEEAIKSINKRKPSMRSAIEQSMEQIFHLEKLFSLLETRTSLDEKQNALITDIKNRKTAIDSNKQELSQLQQTVAIQEQNIEQLEEIALLSARISSLENERKSLQPGVACPLCGSMHHPYAENNHQPQPVSDSSLAREKANLSELKKQIHSIDTAIALHNSKLESTNADLKQTRKLIEETNNSINSLCEKTGSNTSDISTAAVKETLNLQKKIHKDLQKDADTLESLEIQLTTIQNKLESIASSRAIKEQQLNKTTLELERAELLLQDIFSQLSSLTDSVAIKHTEINTILHRYDTFLNTENSITSLGEELTLRLQQWKNKVNHETDLIKQQDLLKSRLQKEESLLEKIADDIRKVTAEYNQTNVTLGEYQKERSELYGTKEPDKEEQHKEDLFSKAVTERDIISAKLENAKNKAAAILERIDRLNISTSARQKQLAEDDQQFSDKLSAYDFTSVENFLKAKLPQEQLQQLDDELQLLDEQITKTQTLLRDKENQLFNEAAKNLTTHKPEELNEKLLEHRRELNEKNQKIGKLQVQLEENSKRIAEQQQKLALLARQKKDLTKWQLLNALIGSASGKKFRNFAQGVTFELMVAHANRSLQKMTDRYILIRDAEQPLELNVIDNYRAGEIRSTKNLSGGESFLVSLALALGLSNMAGDNVRVDSLFLDEGFGTLDEETLETALQALSGLQHEGKMIGIISHVSLLKERLETQIQVIPGQGGHSSLKGPGIISY